MSNYSKTTREQMQVPLAATKTVPAVTPAEAVDLIHNMVAAEVEVVKNEAYADQKVRENDALNYPRIAELEKSEAALEAEVEQLRQDRDALLKQKGEAWASMRKSAMSDLSIVARAERAEGALLHALECMDRNCKQCNDLLAALKSSQKSKGESQ